MQASPQAHTHTHTPGVVSQVGQVISIQHGAHSGGWGTSQPRPGLAVHKRGGHGAQQCLQHGAQLLLWPRLGLLVRGQRQAAAGSAAAAAAVPCLERCTQRLRLQPSGQVTRVEWRQVGAAGRVGHTE